LDLGHEEVGAQRSQDHAYRKRHQKPLNRKRRPHFEYHDLHQDGTEFAERSGDAVEGAPELGWEDFGWDLGVVSICILFSGAV
jgi:hypothetical protein